MDERQHARLPRNAGAAACRRRWVSDGNFAAVSFDIRLPRATQIVWLECPRRLCVWRATRRALGGDRVHRLRKLPEVLRYIRDFDRINRR
ncbi:MAG: hypothetical protein WDM81_12190 [Rhizomicrobium sp.]